MLKNRRIFIPLAVFGVVFVYSAAVATAQKSAVPAGWKQVKACQFSFLLPEDIRQTDVRGIDSCVADYEGDGIRVHLDFGVYNGRSAQREKTMNYYRSSPIVINRRRASLIVYEDSSAAFPRAALIYIVTAPPRNGFRSTSLLMSICKKPPFDAEIVKRIYQSVKYLGK